MKLDEKIKTNHFSSIFTVSWFLNFFIWIKDTRNQHKRNDSLCSRTFNKFGTEIQFPLLFTKLDSVFASGPGDRGSIPGRVIPNTQKEWYLISLCLTLSLIRYVSRVKWSNSRKGVAPFPTPRCSSYWKGSLRVTLNYGRQFYLLILLCLVWSIDCI